MIVVTPTGRLTIQADLNVDITQANSLVDLLGVGARQNAKRPFVFVSKILGKHIPCNPSDMVDVQTSLAAAVGAESAVVIGMAETATGLGQGVFDQLIRLGQTNSVYFSTTRYPVAGTQRIDFTEAHSHATSLGVIFVPGSEAYRRLTQAKRLILVDDELSTGRTFANLVKALQRHAPEIREIDIATLTDFSDGAAVQRLLAIDGIERVSVHALAAGRFEFEQQGAIAPPPIAQKAVNSRHHLMRPEGPRLGLLSPEVVSMGRRIVDACIPLMRGHHVTVIATGEFMYSAQWLALQLQACGFQSVVQSTTRSPLLTGNAIQSIRHVVDVYGEGIPNYIYNLYEGDLYEGDTTRIVVHETGTSPLAHQLCRQLNAISADFLHGAVSAPKLLRAM